MLHLRLMTFEEALKTDGFRRYPGSSFDLAYRSDWIETDFTRRLVREIEHLDIPDDEPVEYSCCLRGVDARSFSTGTKSLLLTKHKDFLLRISSMGPNCYKYLMEICEEKDVTMAATYYCYFTDADLAGRTVHFLNTDEYVSDAAGFKRVMDTVGSGIFGKR